MKLDSKFSVSEVLHTTAASELDAQNNKNNIGDIKL
jgi:hypothetical protein